MLFYPAALPLSSQTLNYTAGVIRRHRRQIGSCWRKLTPGRAGPAGAGLPAQGRDVRRARGRVRRRHRHSLALRQRDHSAAGGPLAKAAAGTGRCEEGRACLRGDRRHVHLVNRVAADWPFFSGKHRRHGMNLQVISASDGEILWLSQPLPGAVHDLTAARIRGILCDLLACGLVVLADKGYTVAGHHVRIPYRGRIKPASQKDANRAHAQLRSPGERATPSSRPGASCANSAAAPGKPGSSPKRSTEIHLM